MTTLPKLILIFVTIPFALDFQTNAINVKGISKVSIEPNIANFKLGMTVKHKEIDSALAKISIITDSINSIFKKYGLDKNSAKIKNIQIGEDREYDRETRKEVFLGYEAKRYYEIKFTKLESLSKFLLETNIAGANDLDNLNFSHTKADSIENSLIKKAMLNARHSAEAAAKSEGVKIKKVSVISDDPPNNYSYQNRVDFDMPNFGDLQEMRVGVSAKGGMRRQKSYTALFEIEPGKIEIKKSVWVTYRIK